MKSSRFEQKKTTERYLTRIGASARTEPNARPLKIVIPALAEFEWILSPIDSLCRNRTGHEAAEIIVVVNNAADASADVAENNRRTLDFLRLDPALHRNLNQAGLLVTVIDRSSEALAFPPESAGVGSARKAGMDTALAKLQPLDFDGLIVCLDADCTVSENYLEALLQWHKQRPDCQCAVVPYEHPIPDDPRLAAAIALYEIRLRYAEYALKKVPTPYSFSTVGSTIVCRPHGYAAAGGMNTRKATEDFYFLMNIAKISEVDRIAEAKVYPSPRRSDRVYLGTGHGVGTILDGQAPCLEHPQCWDDIALGLAIILGGFGKTVSGIEVDLQSKCPAFHDFVIAKRGVRSIENALENAGTAAGYKSRIHQWFDGLKIRQAAHDLRDRCYGDLPWNEAWRLFINSDIPDDPVKALPIIRRFV